MTASRAKPARRDPARRRPRPGQRPAAPRAPRTPARETGRHESAPQPAGRPDPVRLAAVRAYLAFERGGPFAAEPPAALRGEAQRRLYVALLRGLVRHRRLLQAEVARLARRPLARLEPEVVAPAMLGLYQLRFLEVAPHAALYESVALAPALRRPRAKGWVNAVLRAAQREGLRGTESPAPLPPGVRTSHPDWLLERWTRRYGAERALAICEADNRYEGAALRVEVGRITPEALLRRLEDEGAPATAHPLLPGALWSEHLGAVLRSAAFREGLCYVQDVTSQLLMAWVAPVLRGRVLDACAAPGGKLTWLAGLRRANLWAVGAEPGAGRLERLRENQRRLRLPPTPLLRADGQRLPFRDGAWDAVLLDAPCSATGMIRKYPELKWRKHAEDVPRFATLQAALLAEAARVVRPGGWIVYATCSLEPEENEGAVADFLAAQRGFRRVRFAELAPPPGLGADPATLLGETGDLLLLPGERQMGLYAALLQRQVA
jgi:16S rRNA (cytosine967-C5)-methyltransferase